MRNQEFKRYIQTPPELPEQLNDLCARRMAQGRRDRRLTAALRAAACVLLALFVSFTAAINLSPTLALAAGEIPALRSLTALLTFDPSLRAALDNRYGQTLHLAQTVEGVTVRVFYAIADREQLTLFYAIDAPEGQSYDLYSPEVLVDGASIPSASSYGGDPADAQDPSSARRMTLDFLEQPLPDRFTLQMRLVRQATSPQEAPASYTGRPPEREEEQETGPTLAFTVALDPARIAKPQVRDISRWVELDGQRLYLNTLTIYPTHASLSVQADPNNTHIIDALDLYLVDAKGREFGRKQDGITAAYVGGMQEGPTVLRMESSYFSGAQPASLRIGAAELIDKRYAISTLDTKAQTFSPLPAYLHLEALHCANGFNTIRLVSDPPGGNSNYYTPSAQTPIESMSTLMGDMEETGGDYNELRFAGDGVYLFNLCYAPMTTLEEPVEVPLVN